MSWVLCVCVVTLLLARSGAETLSKRKLVILSFDGFRWDYVKKFDTPNFDKLAKEGVSAPEGVKPAFSTKTFPNHYTLVTGLFEESHGIVNNRMYDPEFQASFAPGNNETRWWDGGQPIWITARLQQLKSAVYFWPGSEARIAGVFANYFLGYNESVPFHDRMDQVVDWLSNKNVDVAAAYFHEPDQAGHLFGALSPRVGQAVREMDALLGYFLRQLDEKGLAKDTNLLVVSDHGMANITADEDHVIVLSDYLDMDKEVKLVPQKGVVVMILPHDGMKDVVYRKLKDAKRPMEVYKKDDIPEHYHFKNHRRILPILVIADEGYTIILNRPIDFKRVGPGGHGYSNELRSMRPIFFARGPDFKTNVQLSGYVETVNVYALMCHLLDIEPAPNNGSWQAFSDVLVNGAISVVPPWTIKFIALVVIARVFRCFV